MRFPRFAAVLLVLLLIPWAACAAEFSESSRVYDPALAQRALQIASTAYSPALQASVLSLDGFTKVGEYNYDRSGDDARHVAAYTLYDKPLENGDTAVVVAVRGTGEGEWKLNLDLMPSGDYSLNHAENFFLAAQDILDTHEGYLAALESPVFLLTGHSRGAAVANILGALLTERYGADRVFAYTFATPRTVRGEYPAYDNIFNVINPADLITYLPLPQWGFGRYGVDLLLPVDEPSPELLDAVKSAYRARSDKSGPYFGVDGGSASILAVVTAMAALAPSPADIALPHALAHPGAPEEGEESQTAGEVFLSLFDGALRSQGLSSEAAQRLSQAENDFTPLLMSLSALSGSPGGYTGGSVIIGAHMPAMYGAWMTAALE